ncbi:hypothetical protein [Paenibacillus vini]|uniref:Uncharacterized protein n=1 Tax=Paenibacillus vini TaxID=1476024 RepID=A0ABQ4MFL9_9BACL|nr:hypothetical protein [Paenibacillus vini]GIP54755.1 hypothetical protein J42TS3_37900 [Paenibacillus vini]
MRKRFRLPLNLQLFAEEEDPGGVEQSEDPKTYTQEDVDALTAKIVDLTKTVKWQTLEKLGLSREEIEYCIEHIDADNEQDILMAISELGEELPVLVRVKRMQQTKTFGTDPRKYSLIGTPGPAHPTMRAYREKPDLTQIGRDVYQSLKSRGKIRGR